MPQELERRYLLRTLPSDLDRYSVQIVSDLYFPEHSDHCQLRLRRKGNKYEITKKVPIDPNDLSSMQEHTIPLSEQEYHCLLNAPGKALNKQRYSISAYFGSIEIGVFLDALAGLMIVDFEFTDHQAMEAFKSPSWVGPEITNDNRLAGGELCGRKIDELAQILKDYDFQVSSTGRD